MHGEREKKKKNQKEKEDRGMESKSLSFGWEVCCCSFSCWNLDGGRLFMKGPEGSADVIELRG